LYHRICPLIIIVCENLEKWVGDGEVNGWHVWMVYDDWAWQRVKENCRKKVRARKLEMNASYSYSPVLVPYDSRVSSSCYATTTTRSSHHRPLVSLSLSPFSPSNLLFFQNPNFLTGNTIFVKMQVISLSSLSLFFVYYSSIHLSKFFYQ
jgi:hypothetical protein